MKDPDPDASSALFLAVAFKMQTKNKVFLKFFCLFLTVGTLESVVKDNLPLRSY
jgi:hypothetical protein